MKKLVLIALFLVYHLSAIAQCLLIDVPLKKRIDMSDLIVEGKVVSKQSYWNEAHNDIYTVNTIETYKIFKGDAHEQIQVVLPGGQVDDFLIYTTPSLTLNPDQTGMLLLKSTSPVLNSTLACYSAFGSEESFIRYDLVTGTAAEPFHHYENFAALYREIMDVTKNTFKEIKELKLGNRLNNKLANPVITSFTPTTVPGGTNAILTIRGSGFEQYKNNGYVSFRDADDPTNYTNLITNGYPYYVSWSDTMIKVKVPGDVANYFPATGTIKVTTDHLLSATSSTWLTVPWVLTETIVGGTNVPIILYKDDASGGYIFTRNDSFALNVPAVNAFTRAMDTWRCATHVNWSISGSTSTITTSAMDGVNIVKFGDVPLTAIGECKSYVSLCSTGAAKIIEMDVTFELNSNWQFGPALPTGSQNDFESVALHELGHGQRLCHIQDTVVMNPINNNKRVLKVTTEKVAGDSAIAHSLAKAATCSVTAMTLLTSSNCVIGINEIDAESAFSIYPNPSHDSFKIILGEALKNDFVKMEIFDLTGRLIKEERIQNLAVLDCAGFSRGIYLLKIANKENMLTRKLVID